MWIGFIGIGGDFGGADMPNEGLERGQAGGEKTSYFMYCSSVFLGARELYFMFTPYYVSLAWGFWSQLV